jgi:hypothetical protein
MGCAPVHPKRLSGLEERENFRWRNLLVGLLPLSLRMVYQEYDFTRNPVVEDEVFFLESKCIRCGFTVVARSLEGLLEEEKRHRPQCPLARAA